MPCQSSRDCRAALPLLLAGWLMLTALAVLAADGAGTVRAKVLNVRARPGEQYEVVHKLHADDRVEILEVRENWLRIRLPSAAAAWVLAQHLSPAGEVTASGVRVHSGPSVLFTDYFTLQKGDRVELVEEARNNWQRIRAPAGSSAWVSRAFVDFSPEPAAAAAAADTEAAAGVLPVMLPAPAVATAPETPATATGAAPALPEKPQADKNAARLLPPIDLRTPQSADSETKAVPVPPPAPPAPRQTIQEGVVLVASEGGFILCRVAANGFEPLFSLTSHSITLHEWERRQVRIYGRETRLAGQSRPVIEVTGIQYIEKLSATPR